MSMEYAPLHLPDCLAKYWYYDTLEPLDEIDSGLHMFSASGKNGKWQDDDSDGH